MTSGAVIVGVCFRIDCRGHPPLFTFPCVLCLRAAHVATDLFVECILQPLVDFAGSGILAQCNTRAAHADQRFNVREVAMVRISFRSSVAI